MTDEEAAARTGLPLSEIKRRKAAGQAKVRTEMQGSTSGQYAAPVKSDAVKATTDALRGGGASFQTERAMRELNL